jgi:DNA repair protein RecN (Recombination protein N)
MLKSLYIKNYALIAELTVEFPPGLVIITGETGAGKSIIIDALGLILGERTSAESVRSGADKAIVEGVFHTAGNRKLNSLLKDNKLEPADELLVRREISAKGQSRCFLNDSPVPAALMKQIGDLLVDLHGQHEHQSLLRVENHIAMLDDFGGLDGMVEEYHTGFRKLQGLNEELRDLRLREQQLRERRELYQFQLQEIDAVAPRSGEEEEIETELRILENAEKLFEATGKLYQTLYEGEQSVHDLLVVARNQLGDLAGIDKQFGDAAKECASAVAIVGELAKFVQSYTARVEFNPERLESLRQRLGKILHLKRKYGGTLDNVLAHRETIAHEVALAENFNEVLDRLSAERAAALKECSVMAQRLSSKRTDVARKIDKAIVSELGKLGIPDAKFSTAITQPEIPSHPDGSDTSTALGKRTLRLGRRGYDEVEFFISTNIGEDPKPLTRVASGGEISRIMLALKSILAKSDRLPVLIFDEIDVGVSGRVAQAVGLNLKSLADFHQVVAITHLPQIAGLADVHFAVYKEEEDGRAVTRMRKLNRDERVREVAKLMSGKEVTEAGLKGARELMATAKR